MPHTRNATISPPRSRRRAAAAILALALAAFSLPSVAVAAPISDGTNTAEMVASTCLEVNPLIIGAAPHASTSTEPFTIEASCDTDSQFSTLNVIDPIPESQYFTSYYTDDTHSETVTVAGGDKVAGFRAVHRFTLTNAGPAATTEWWIGELEVGLGSSPRAFEDVCGTVDWSTPDYADGVIPAGAAVTVTCHEDPRIGHSENQSMPYTWGQVLAFTLAGNQAQWTVRAAYTVCWLNPLLGQCDGKEHAGNTGWIGAEAGGIIVVPDQPTLRTPACGQEATIRYPSTNGVTYSTVRDGNTVTVTATPRSGYVLGTGVPTTWVFTIPPIVPCVDAVPPAPTLSATECGVQPTVIFPTSTTATYTQVRSGNNITVMAAPRSGYVFPDETTTQWRFDVTAEPCPTSVTTVAPSVADAGCDTEPTVSIPVVDGITYTQERDGDTVTVTATADTGFVLVGDTSWTFSIATEPCPESTVVPTVTPTTEPSPTATSESTITPSPSATVSPTPEPIATVGPTPTATLTVLPTPALSPVATPQATADATASATPVTSPTSTATATPSPTATTSSSLAHTGTRPALLASSAALVLVLAALVLWVARERQKRLS